jgi:DNA-binding response OmpR family regulator
MVTQTVVSTSPDTNYTDVMRTPLPSSKARAAYDRATILVVDDDPSILTTVSEVLEFEGYNVDTAANGAEAIVAIERSCPGLVLLDMRMPVLDGWGFARELRERGVVLPILVMTAARDARRWAEEIGAQGYIAKPFELDDLLGAVDHLLAN